MIEHHHFVLKVLYVVFQFNLTAVYFPDYSFPSNEKGMAHFNHSPIRSLSWHNSNQSFFFPTCSKLIWNMAYEDTARSLFFPALAKEDLHLITECQSLLEFSSVVNCCPLEALLLPFVWFCSFFVHLALLRRPHSAFDSVICVCRACIVLLI